MSLHNGEYVPDRRHSFSFGDSILASRHEALKALSDALNQAHVIIGHDLTAERRLLTTLFDFDPSTWIWVDTRVLFKEQYPNHPSNSLRSVLDVLGIDYGILHNAGNDAKYALLAFNKLSRQAPGLFLG